MRRVFTTAAMLTLVSCATTPPAPTFWDQARKVTVGMSEAEVIVLIGKPNGVTTVGDRITWRWTAFSVAGSRWLSLPMRDGKVAAIPAMPFE